MPQAQDSTQLPTISEPAPTLESLYVTVLQIKQLVEALAGQRAGQPRLAAITWKDLDGGRFPAATQEQAGIVRLANANDITNDDNTKAVTAADLP